MAEYRTLDAVAAETQSELLQGLIPYFTQDNELLTWINKVTIDRKEISINRVASVGSASLVACDTSMVSEAVSAANVTFSLKDYYRQFEVCGAVMGYGSMNDEVAEQLAGAAQALGDKIATDMVAGNGTTGMLGLDGIVTNSFAIGGSGFALTDLDKLIDEVPFKSGKMALVTDKATRRIIKAELNADGDKSRIELANNVFVPGYEGIPVIAHSAVTAGQCYLINGDMLNGSYLAIGERPGEELAPFRLVDVGWREAADRRIWRLFVAATMVTKSTQSLARLTGIVA
jgi:hypothetical protein